MSENVTKRTEFLWESQLRFYWSSDLDNLRIEQCAGVFPYGYEYLGLTGRLVITPLTDRCVLTLTQALSMHLGASPSGLCYMPLFSHPQLYFPPSGPAGTGKTETVKDLAKTMGLLCMVTNCGSGMDYQSIAKLFSGLVQTGKAPGVFKIGISVLRDN